MKASAILKISFFFSAAVLFALMVQWIRQQPPSVSEAGWAFQVVEILDQSGDLHHALEALPNALADPESVDAAMHFQEAVELRKKQAPVVMQLIDEEILDTERQYKIPRLKIRKGIIYELLKQDQEALKWFREAVLMKPGLSIAYVRIGLVLERLNRRDEAKEHFQKALSLNPETILSQFHYAMFLARSREFKYEALALAQGLEPHRPHYSKLIRKTLEDDGPSNTTALN